MTDYKSEASQVPTEPKARFADWLGRWTIVLNGTVTQKEMNQPSEISVEYRQEVIEFVNRLIESTAKAEYRRGIEDAAKVADKAICEDCTCNPHKSSIDFCAVPKAIRSLAEKGGKP